MIIFGPFCTCLSVSFTFFFRTSIRSIRFGILPIFLEYFSFSLYTILCYIYLRVNESINIYVHFENFSFLSFFFRINMFSLRNKINIRTFPPFNPLTFLNKYLHFVIKNDGETRSRCYLKYNILQQMKKKQKKILT